MKFKNILMTLLHVLVVLLLVVVFISDYAGKLDMDTVFKVKAAETTADGWEYTVSDDAVTITGYIGESTEIIIPDKIDGKYVVAIGNKAFAGNTVIENIKICDYVESIGDKCFEGCKHLVSLDFGKSVKRIGSYIFNNCSAMTELTIPKTVTSAGDWYYGGALEGSSIETVTFEEGIANIPAYVCKNASSVKKVVIPEKTDTVDGYTIGKAAFMGTSITEIAIPKSVTKIEESAFRDCTLLTNVSIPDNVAEIGGRCFAGCKRLNTLSLGISVETLGTCLLEDCVSMTEITIPKTVTSAGDWYYGGAFEGSSVEVLMIEYGMNKIPDYLAKNCSSLKTVYVPDSVEVIGLGSFVNCINLEWIKSNRETFLFSANSFNGCNKLYDSRFSVLDTENTYLVTNLEQANVNGIVNYTIRYRLMPSVAEFSENIELRIDLPEALTLLPESIQSKNITFDPEQIRDGVIPVDSPEGELRFTVRVTEIGSYQVSAQLNFDYNNSRWEQSIGMLDVECPDITVAVPETVNEYIAEVYGIAAKNQDVSVYVNDKLAGTFRSNAYTGKYKGNVSLPVGKTGTAYSIYAECGGKATEAVTTVYSAEKPVVKKVVFNYNQHSDNVQTLDITDVFTRGTSPVISFNPAYRLSFEITATNNDRIDRMFVISTKANSERYIEAFYNRETGTWITEAYFDENSRSYVPGSLNISILEKSETVLDGSYDYEQDQKLEELPVEFAENSSVEIVGQNNDAFLANIEVSDGVAGGKFQLYSNDKSDGVYIGGTYYSADTIAKDPERYGFVDSGLRTIESGKTVTYYIHDSDNSDIISTMLLDFSSDLKTAKDVWTGKSVLKVIEGDDADSFECDLANAFVTEGTNAYMKYVFGDTYGDIGKGLSMGSDFMKYCAQMEMAGDNKKYQEAATLLFGLKMFNSLATGPILNACGIEPPFSTVIKFFIGKGIGLIDSYITDCIQNNREFSLAGFLRFIIDPSGIVYEAVPGNVLEGATVTVYYKDPETGSAVKWNAEDYDQGNPLFTDYEGKYLWDVPEGEWKVVCEKDGYETMETEWMGIPPIRTDVDFSMVSKAAPELVSAELTADGITVKLSKFVDISTVSSDTLKLDSAGEYTIIPKPLSEEDKYADTFVIVGAAAREVSITQGIVSYAGTPAKQASLSIAQLAGDVIPGDVNGDGEINAKDVTTLRRYLAGGWNVEIVSGNSDTDGDGNINAKDVTILRRYLAGGWGVQLGKAA